MPQHNWKSHIEKALSSPKKSRRVQLGTEKSAYNTAWRLKKLLKQGHFKGLAPHALLRKTNFRAKGTYVFIEVA